MEKARRDNNNNNNNNNNKLYYTQNSKKLPLIYIEAVYEINYDKVWIIV